MSAIVSSELTSATLESVVVNNDLSKLTPAQRLEWYNNRCQAAGLDPRTQPFQYITLQGKLTLYATKAATDQLIANRRLTVQIVDRKHIADLDLYEVQVRVTFPDGHTVDDMAALMVGGLKGEALANAVMKCVTKAKRRTVLSACGLGMLDETETETIPQARVVSVDYHTGEVVGGPISEAKRKALFASAKDAGITNDELKMIIKREFGRDGTVGMTEAEYQDLMEMILEFAENNGQ